MDTLDLPYLSAMRQDIAANGVVRAALMPLNQGDTDLSPLDGSPDAQGGPI